MSTSNQQACSSSLKSTIPNGLTLAVERVFSKLWVKTLRAKWSMPSGLVDYVHPCYIDKQHTLVHARDLAFSNPDLYKNLQTYAQQEGYRLLADRREQDVEVASDRRRKWLPVFTLSLGLSVAVHADNNEQSAVENTLALFDTPLTSAIEEPPASTVDDIVFEPGSSYDFDQDTPLIDHVEDLVVDPLAESMADILRSHYRAAVNDPEYLEDDLQDMAIYFSRYPEAVRLLTSIKDYSWILSYEKNTFETQVRGNQIQVKAVAVNFDSRAAAQLRSHRSCRETENRGVCIASPADALLHELLHVKSALLHSAEFIQQGGMNSVLYPYAHEAAVIKSENSLYQSMSQRDGQYRPGRHAHSGRVVASSCSTCLN